MKRRFLGIAALAVALLVPAVASAGEEPEKTPAQPETSVRGVLEGGMNASTLFRLPTTGFHGDAGFSVDRGHVSIPVLLNLDLGTTKEGLHTGQFMVSGGAQYHGGRFRIGGGAELGYFWLTRAAYQTEGNIGAASLGIFALTSFDVIDFGGDRAIALSARGEIVGLDGLHNFDFKNGTAAPRGSLALGFRF